MDFLTIFIKRRSWVKTSGEPAQIRRRAGFTLIEVLVTTAIASALIVAVASISMFSGRSLAALANYSELEQQSRIVLDRMTMEIRQAIRLTAFGSNAITLTDWDHQSLKYVYDPSARALTRLKNNQVAVLLQGCDSLTFVMYQRNTTNGTYSQYPASSPATCKLLEINWVCTRSMLGPKANTESVQSAKVCIRKR